MKDSSKSLIYVSIAVASWSTVASAFKIALRHYTYYELLLVAAITATVLFALVITIQRKWYLLKSIAPKEWGLFAITGTLSPAGYYLILLKAYELLPAQIAQSINYSWAIVLTLLLAVVMKQRIPTHKYIGMTISLGGVVLISLGSESIMGVSLPKTGLLLAFFSTFVWASFWILNKKSEQIDNVLALFISFLFGSLFLLIGLLFVEVQLYSIKGALPAIYVGLFEMVVPFIFFSLAHKKTDNPALINQLCYLSPFISLFIIRSVLGEQIYFTTFIGLLLIVGGILFNEYGVKKLKRQGG